MHAVGRIAYRGAIDNVQVSWVKCGTAGARQILQAGANDYIAKPIDVDKLLSLCRVWLHAN